MTTLASIRSTPKVATTISPRSTATDALAMELRANDKGSDIYAAAFFICTGTNGSDHVAHYERGPKCVSAVSQIIHCAIKGLEVDCAKELALLRIREHLYRVKLLGNWQCLLGDWFNADFRVHPAYHCATFGSERDWLLTLRCGSTNFSRPGVRLDPR